MTLEQCNEAFLCDDCAAELRPHVCAPRGRSVFCQCGKLVDRDGLRNIAANAQGFKGKDSMSPRVSAFLNTGEPELLRPEIKIDGLGLD